MAMTRKYFPMDKNYILEEAQVAVQEELMNWLIEEVKKNYLAVSNPLGLIDDTVLRIQNHQCQHRDEIEDFYNNLAGVYRYKFGDNQLEILFDGSNHFIKYKYEWKYAFQVWVREFCRNESFIKSMLGLTVFRKDDQSTVLLSSKLQQQVNKFFAIRMYKKRGIVSMKIA